MEKISINLYNENLDDQVIFNACKKLNTSNVGALRLVDNHITTKGIKILSETLTTNTRIEELDLSQTHKLDEESIKYISEMLKKNSTIHTLYLDQIIIGSNIRYLAEALTINTTIQRLSLKSINIDDNGLEYLTKSLMINTTLLDLNLAYNDDIKKIDFIANMLRINDTLETLILDEINMSFDNVQSLCEALKQNTKLNALVMTKCNIGFDSAVLIGDLIKHNSTLELLTLTYNNLNNEGIAYIYENLKKFNTTLLNLFVDGNDSEMEYSGSRSTDYLRAKTKSELLSLITSELLLNKNYITTSLHEANYLDLLKKRKHMIDEEITIFDKEKFSQNISTWSIVSKTTLYLYWILNHFFPRDLINEILEKKYWIKGKTLKDKTIYYDLYEIYY